MKRMICLTLALMALTLSLTACSLLGGNRPQEEKSNLSASSEGSQSSAPDESDKDAKEEKVVQGIINKLGSYLVLLTEDEEYQIMDYGEGVTVDGFQEGDKVEITYTGELGSDTETPVVVTMEKIK